MKIPPCFMRVHKLIQALASARRRKENCANVVEGDDGTVSHIFETPR